MSVPALDHDLATAALPEGTTSSDWAVLTEPLPEGTSGSIAVW